MGGSRGEGVQAAAVAACVCVLRSSKAPRTTRQAGAPPPPNARAPPKPYVAERVQVKATPVLSLPMNSKTATASAVVVPCSWGATPAAYPPRVVAA